MIELVNGSAINDCNYFQQNTYCPTHQVIMYLVSGGIMIGLETQPFNAYMFYEFMNAHIFISLEKPTYQAKK